MIVHWVKQRVVAVASKPLRDDRNHLRRSLVKRQAVRKPTFVRYDSGALGRQGRAEWFAERHPDNDRGESSNVLGKKAALQKFLAATTDIIVPKENSRSGHSKYWLPDMASRAEGLRAF